MKKDLPILLLHTCRYIDIIRKKSKICCSIYSVLVYSNNQHLVTIAVLQCACLVLYCVKINFEIIISDRKNQLISYKNYKLYNKSYTVKYLVSYKWHCVDTVGEINIDKFQVESIKPQNIIRMVKMSYFDNGRK